jgi:hypothetical protein
LCEGRVQRRVGISNLVENSVGCLSEKRLFIKIGKSVVDDFESSARPACVSRGEVDVRLSLTMPLDRVEFDVAQHHPSHSSTQ